MTAFPSFNAGTVPTAAQWQTLKPIGTYKSTGENRNNTTTFADDAVLRADFGNTNCNYLVLARIIHNSSATADFKFQFADTSGGGTTMSFTATGIPLTLTTLQNSEGGLGTAMLYEGGGANRAVIVVGVLSVGTNTGAIKLQWAQNTSDASFTAVAAGSFLRLEQMA
jgi:hypothetical protein